MAAARHILIVTLLVAGGWAAAKRPGTRPAPPAKGRLQLTFTERSPLSGWDVMSERLYLSDEPKGTRALFEYDLAAESFDVFVPASYRPGAPHGLFVWMGVPDFPPPWLDVLARHKLIFVSAKYVRDRCETNAKALDAVHNMKQRYDVDPKRIYVSGFSGGGVTATHMVKGYPDVFSGGYFLVWGGGFYGSRLNDKKQWEVGMDTFPAWKGPLDQIKKDMKLVILKAELDGLTAPQGRAVYDALLLDGFTRVSYLEVPRLAHRLPNTAWFEKGVAALEAKPRTPPATGPTTRPNPLPGQVAYARRLVTSAQLHLTEKPGPPRRSVENARTYLRQAVRDYPTTPAAAEARALLQKHSPPTTQPADG